MELPKGEVKDDILRSQLRHWQIPVRLGPVEKPMLLAGKVAYIGYPSASDYLTERRARWTNALGQSKRRRSYSPLASSSGGSPNSAPRYPTYRPFW